MNTKTADQIISDCVKCGFCTSICPSYSVTGDERDSPRGRIALIKELLTGQTKNDETLIKHLDRCLTCHACATACPSNVDYPTLIDDARAYIAQNKTRAPIDALLRHILLNIIPYKKRFFWSLKLARLFSPLGAVLSYLPHQFFKRTAALLKTAGQTRAQRPDMHTRISAQNSDSNNRATIRNVILFEGCAQPVLAPEINRATRELLEIAGFNVITVGGEGCCGALSQHLGYPNDASQFAEHNMKKWYTIHQTYPIHAIIYTTSGCGQTLKKSYTHAQNSITETDEGWANFISNLQNNIFEISEFLIAENALPELENRSQSIGWHTPCSSKHALKGAENGKLLLEKAGYDVIEIAENDICCGSAGVYNMLEPEIADALKSRKLKHIKEANIYNIATANIGCITQLSTDKSVNIKHVVEYLAESYEKR